MTGITLPLPFISKMLDMQNHSEFSLWFFVIGTPDMRTGSLRQNVSST